MGVDLVLEVTDPAGHLLKVDGPYAERGTERTLVEAGASGLYEVAVKAPEEEGGAYVLRWEVRAVTDAERPLLDAYRVLAEGDAARRADAYERALDAYERAARLFAETPNDEGRSLALHRLGQALKRRDPRDPEAVRAYAAALEAALAAGLRAQAADLAFGLGRLHAASDAATALDALGRAEELYAETGDVRRQAVTVNERARVLEVAGRLDEARSSYSRAAELGHGLDDPRWQAAFLNNLGEVHLRLGQPDVAHRLFEEVLPLRRAAEDRRGEGITLTSRGNAERRLGRLDDARRSFEEARRLLEAVDDRPRQANALVGLGLAELQKGRFTEAEGYLTSALDLATAPRARALILLDLGDVALARAGEGDAERARAQAERARPLFEEVGDRQGLASADFAFARAARLEGQLDDAARFNRRALERIESVYEDVRVDPLRMSYLAFRREYYELAVDTEVALGRTKEAVALSERARARSLLTALHGDRPMDAVDAAFDVDRFRAVHLDDDTALLVVSLGEAVGHLFWIDRDGVTVHPLPGRRELDPLALAVHESLQKSHMPLAAARFDREARNLSRLVLGPVAGSLGDQRLVVVAEGALLYVPFAALPDPRRLDDDDPPPLIERHEVVRLPSMAVLDALRNASGRPDGRRTLAVIADPVFADGDRLPATAMEASAILGLVPEEERFAALGHDASVDVVLSGALRDFRIVHFATHGRLDTELPDQSGLELSDLDRNGRPRPGLLLARHLEGLTLDADLVVLSACRTALGREVRGEGLVGLVQAFFKTGAPRVVVSLWRVHDEATRELMVRFYDHLLKEGASPPAALRAAQRELRTEERWRAPYYWAGFVVEGDWR